MHNHLVVEGRLLPKKEDSTIVTVQIDTERFWRALDTGTKGHLSILWIAETLEALQEFRTITDEERDTIRTAMKLIYSGGSSRWTSYAFWKDNISDDILDILGLLDSWSGRALRLVRQRMKRKEPGTGGEEQDANH